MALQYLTGATGSYLEDSGVAAEHDIGLLVQPGNYYHRRVHLYGSWAADNGAYSQVGSFCPRAFRKMLARPQLVAAQSTCLFVAAPDVLHFPAPNVVVGDAAATLAQYPEWAAEIRALGYPVALVAQDGLEALLDDVPWQLVDALFVGGSTRGRVAWKTSAAAQACVSRARREGKRTHMGRVNSFRRLEIAQSWGVDSADGTFLQFGGPKNVPRLIDFLDKLRRSHRQGNLLRDL